MAKSFTPPQSVRNAAEQGLALRKKWGRGGLSTSEASKEGVGSGVARARDLINGDVSLDTVKRMHAFFERHEKNIDAKKKESDGGPSAGFIAGKLWGWPSGRAWARNILRKEGIIKSMDGLPFEDEWVEDEVKWTAEVAKAVNEELKQATFVVMSPDEFDLHNDTTSMDEVRKAKENFNQFLLNQAHSRIDHLYDTEDYKIIESYLAPADMVLNGVEVKKGAWLATIQVYADELWEGIKSNRYQGLSIGALGRVEEIEDETE